MTQLAPRGTARISLGLTTSQAAIPKRFEVLRENSAEYPALPAAFHARLGQVETARTLISDYLKSGGDDVIEREDMFPIVEPTETEFLNVLRKTGLGV